MTRLTGADYPRMYCDTCPFNSNDPLAWYGHEARRGWLGNGEVHTMRPEQAPLRPTIETHGAAITGLVPKIEGRFLQPRAFTRSRGRRFLEWAAAWLHYYIR